MTTPTISRRPRLQLRHTPGWTMEIHHDGEPVLTVFESDQNDFGISFEADIFPDATVSSSISPLANAYLRMSDPTPDALADLANRTDRLQQWLDDCAEILQWVIDHRTELARHTLASPVCHERLRHFNKARKGPERNHMDQPEEPEPYRHMNRADLIALIQSLTVESASHRRGKRFWKKRCAELENKLDNL